MQSAEGVRVGHKPCTRALVTSNKTYSGNDALSLDIKLTMYRKSAPVETQDRCVSFYFIEVNKGALLRYCHQPCRGSPVV